MIMQPIPNGTVVYKTNSKKGDTHPDGAQAKVISSYGPIVIEKVPQFSYLVEWDDMPGQHVFVIGRRITPERNSE